MNYLRWVLVALVAGFIVGVAATVPATKAYGAQGNRYQILIRVPAAVTDSLGNVIEPHSNPDSVLSRACSVDSRMGQVTVNNRRFSIFGYVSATHRDTVTLNLLKKTFPDIEVRAIEIEEGGP